MIAELLARPPRLGAVRLIAIDGPSGAGKTVIAARLAADLRAEGVPTALVPTDHFATGYSCACTAPRCRTTATGSASGDPVRCWFRSRR